MHDSPCSDNPVEIEWINKTVHILSTKDLLAKLEQDKQLTARSQISDRFKISSCGPSFQKVVLLIE